MREPTDLERAINAFAASPNGGLIAVSNPQVGIHRALVIALAARHRLPAVYFDSYFVAEGGLVSYGPDEAEEFSSAAGYVDRILRGEKPGDLPVQFPTKFEMLVNRSTAKALGLAVPPSIMLRATEVIE